MEHLPHEITWEEIRAQYASCDKPYSLIGRVLVDRCFTKEVCGIEKMLHQSLPLLDAELKRFVLLVRSLSNIHSLSITVYTYYST